MEERASFVVEDLCKVKTLFDGGGQVTGKGFKVTPAFLELSHKFKYCLRLLVNICFIVSFFVTIV